MLLTGVYTSHPLLDNVKKHCTFGLQWLPLFNANYDGYDDDYDDDGGDGDYARYNQQLSDFNVQWVSD